MGPFQAVLGRDAEKKANLSRFVTPSGRIEVATATANAGQVYAYFDYMAPAAALNLDLWRRAYLGGARGS